MDSFTAKDAETMRDNYREVEELLRTLVPIIESSEWANLKVKGLSTITDIHVLLKENRSLTAKLVNTAWKTHTEEVESRSLKLIRSTIAPSLTVSSPALEDTSSLRSLDGGERE